MNNLPMNLESVAPVDHRLRCYKEALVYYQKRDFKRFIRSMDNSNKPIGLCLLLPCILWNLDHYLEYSPDGDVWCYLYTPITFPEMKEVVEILNTGDFNQEEKINKRIKALEEAINKLNSSYENNN